MSRRTASWMCLLDERILEHLSDEPWSSPSIMASTFNFDASEDRIDERCRMLADAELVHFSFGDTDLVEITSWGMLYLNGEIDAESQPESTKRALRG